MTELMMMMTQVSVCVYCVVCWALPVCNWKQSSKQFVFPIECFSIALDDDNDNDDGTDANVIVR